MLRKANILVLLMISLIFLPNISSACICPYKDGFIIGYATWKWTSHGAEGKRAILFYNGSFYDITPRRLKIDPASSDQFFMGGLACGATKDKVIIAGENGYLIYTSLTDYSLRWVYDHFGTEHPVKVVCSPELCLIERYNYPKGSELPGYTYVVMFNGTSINHISESSFIAELFNVTNWKQLAFDNKFFIKTTIPAYDPGGDKFYILLSGFVNTTYFSLIASYNGNFHLEGFLPSPYNLSDEYAIWRDYYRDFACLNGECYILMTGGKLVIWQNGEIKEMQLSYNASRIFILNGSVFIGREGLSKLVGEWLVPYISDIAYNQGKFLIQLSDGTLYLLENGKLKKLWIEIKDVKSETTPITSTLSEIKNLTTSTTLETQKSYHINYDTVMLLGFILLITAMLGLLIWKKRENNQ